ncbi:MAG: NADH-quinone oxidoreductase subunit F, partial [Thermodesulfobacteriota bacterium]|nr:NADH-quinone oxidoreductase subunit F [Thermodesulfobacteriota bacterium]
MNPNDSERVNEIYKGIYEEAVRRRNELKGAPVPKISIGMATCGIASGAAETKKAFEETLAERGLEARVRSVGCIGHCYAEPVVIIDHPGSGFPPIFYHQVTPGKARMLVRSFLEEGDPLFEHVLGAMEENEIVPHVMDFPRFNQEIRVIMARCGHIDPADIYDYIAEGGYGALG